MMYSPKPWVMLYHSVSFWKSVHLYRWFYGECFFMDALGWCAENRRSHIGRVSECDSPIFQLLKDAKNTPQQLFHSQPQQPFVWRAFNPKKLLPSGPTWNSTSWQNAEIAHLRWHNIKYLIFFVNWGPDRVCRRILKHNLHAFVFGIWP